MKGELQQGFAACGMGFNSQFALQKFWAAEVRSGSTTVFRPSYWNVRCSSLSDRRAAYSITSSAVICMVSGTVRPSAFAALRLITYWNFSGC